jgi:hypothetical protein
MLVSYRPLGPRLEKFDKSLPVWDSSHCELMNRVVFFSFLHVSNFYHFVELLQ